MNEMRHLLRHRWISVIALVVVALLARMMIPTGFMPMVEDGHVVLTLCSGHGPMQVDMTAMQPGSRMGSMIAKLPHPNAPDPSDHSKDGPCAFAGLSLSSLVAADAVLLAVALVFIIATMFRIAPARRATCQAFLRPPLRGPPALT